MLLFILFVVIGLFFIYLLIDLMAISKNFNKFGSKWLEKTLWIWLPFYALWRLTKEVILGKRRKE